VCRTALVPRYPEYVVGLCETFLYGELLGICAAAVSASVKLPIQTKKLRFIISPLFNFANQTPVISESFNARARGKKAFLPSSFLILTSAFPRATLK
jgi:hypothetical protein